MPVRKQNRWFKLPAKGRKWSEKGASIIEFALVILPLLALVFGIINVSWILFAQNTLQQAVREGVRYGITGRTMGGMGLNGSIQQVVQNYSFGFLNPVPGCSDNPPPAVNIKYYSQSDLTTPLAPDDPSSPTGGNVLQVSVTGVQFCNVILITLQGAGIGLSATASDVMESSPPGQLPPL
jgi:TadE-like protein